MKTSEKSEISRRNFLYRSAVIASGSLASYLLPNNEARALYWFLGRIIVAGSRMLLGQSARVAARQGVRQGSRRAWINLGQIAKFTATGVAVERLISVSPAIAKTIEELDINLLLVAGDDNEIFLEGDSIIEEFRPLHLVIEKMNLETGYVDHVGPFPWGLNPGDTIQIPVSKFPELGVFNAGAHQIFARTNDDTVYMQPSPRYLVADKNEVLIQGG